MAFSFSAMSSFAVLRPWRERPPSDNVFVIFNSPQIYDLIFSCLSPPAIIFCSRTSRLLYRASKDFNRRSYNITNHLSHFFDNPSSFRNIQATTGAVISGSNAIQFLDRCFYDGSDLDIFVDQFHALKVAKWLIKSEGYLYKPFRGQDVDIGISLMFTEIERDVINGCLLQSDEYRGSGVSAIFEFLKEGDKKVQLITTAVSPIHCILSFHTTCVMNFITFEGACSLYPNATFNNRETITVGPVDKRVGRALAKYAIRGWTVYASNFADADLRRVLFFDKRRHVLDRYSWFIPFDTTDIVPRQRPTPSSITFTSDPSLYNSWILRTGSTTHAEFVIISSKLLVHNYIVASEEEFQFINDMLQTQEKLELLKVPIVGHDQVTNDAWTYWDGLYARWCGH